MRTYLVRISIFFAVFTMCLFIGNSHCFAEPEPRLTVWTFRGNGSTNSTTTLCAAGYLQAADEPERSAIFVCEIEGIIATFSAEEMEAMLSEVRPQTKMTFEGYETIDRVLIGNWRALQFLSEETRQFLDDTEGFALLQGGGNCDDTSQDNPSMRAQLVPLTKRVVNFFTRAGRAENKANRAATNFMNEVEKGLLGGGTFAGKVPPDISVEKFLRLTQRVDDDLAASFGNSGFVYYVYRYKDQAYHVAQQVFPDRVAQWLTIRKITEMNFEMLLKRAERHWNDIIGAYRR